MVEPITINVRHLSQDVRIPQEQVQAAVDLLDAGVPISFIARYRKEATKNLNEESLRRIDEELRSARFLCERKLTILKTIESAGKLTPDLDKNIREAKSVKRLEDLHLPFKPKRQNPAAAARDNGLEPLALEILEGKLPADKLDERAAEFINVEKNIKSVADVFLGTGHIIADIFGCKAEVMHKVRDIIYQHGQLTSTKIEKTTDSAANVADTPAQKKTGGNKRKKGVVPAADVSVADTEKTAVQAEDTAAKDRADTVKAAEDSGVIVFEPVAVPNEQLTPQEQIDQTEIDTDIVGVELADDSKSTDDRETGTVSPPVSPEAAATEGTTGPTGEEGTEGAEGTAEPKEADVSSPLADASPSPSTTEIETQEVAELFQQLKEEQAEKGMPVVRSQNAIKKEKKAEAKKKKIESKKRQDELKQQQREHFGRQFAEYFDFAIKLRGLPAHHILALNRGERHKTIQVAVKVDEAKVLETLKEIFVPQDHPFAEFLTGCLQDSLHRSILPMLYREIRDDMTEYAEKNVIRIFGYNLRNLLLQRPVGAKRVLALDPSPKQGCKAVALDEFGNLLGHETIFIAQNKERRESAEQTLAEMIRRFGITVIAIGGGGGCRQVEELVASMLESHFSAEQGGGSDLVYAIVNKAGSIAYSTSPIGKEELHSEDPFVRAAISIGRRLQNPLTELVKIEPVNLGLFHHDIRGKYVKQMLSEVVDSSVNVVGVDVNLATPTILSHIAGLNPMTARRIYEYRREHGRFRTREDLKKVSGINETAYTYAVGFLRIIGGDNPLDSTNIHPESYELAANVLEKLGFSVNDLQRVEKQKAIAEKIASEKFGELTIKLSSECNVGLETVRDILVTFSNFGQESKESQLPVVFRRTTVNLESLTPGTELIGTILNVTNFGAFVDIGLHESGFIHVSQMASGFIQDPHERVITGNTVRCWVVEADATKKRVSLTLLPPGTEKQAPRTPDKSGREHSPQERDSRPPRQDRPRRDFSDKPKGETPGGDRPPRDSRDGRRFERRDYKSFDRAPKTFVTAPIKKDVKPITEEMKKGKEPMRSFSDLAQLFGRTQTDTDEKKEKK